MIEVHLVYSGRILLSTKYILGFPSRMLQQGGLVVILNEDCRSTNVTTLFRWNQIDHVYGSLKPSTLSSGDSTASTRAVPVLYSKVNDRNADIMLLLLST